MLQPHLRNCGANFGSHHKNSFRMPFGGHKERCNECCTVDEQLYRWFVIIQRAKTACVAQKVEVKEEEVFPWLLKALERKVPDVSVELLE